MIPGTFMLPGMMAGGGGSLPDPEIIATNTGQSGGSASSSFNAPLPAGIVADDLLVMIVLIADQSSRTLSTPSGWTQLYNATTPSEVNLRSAVYYRIATGGEGSTRSIAASGSAYWAVNSYLIRGAANIEAAGANGTGLSANPPALNPAFGDAAIWIAAAHFEASSGSETSASGYGDQLRTRCFPEDEVEDIGVNVTASKAEKSSSENPGTFSNTWYPGAWHAITIGIG